MSASDDNSAENGEWKSAANSAEIWSLGGNGSAENGDEWKSAANSAEIWSLGGHGSAENGGSGQGASGQAGNGQAGSGQGGPRGREAADRARRVGDVSQPSFDLEIEGDDGGAITYTVAELGEAINGALRRSFYDGVWVRGEIQGWREGPNGHAYFNLVDDTSGVKATVAVSFFANLRIRLRPMLARHRLRLGDGMKVRINGGLDYYAPNGRLGLKMAGIDPRYTLGEISLARDELVRTMVAEGLYDANKSRPFPQVPLRVGVVTSVGSAAWHDFSHELEASGLRFRLRVTDVRVQGEGAIPMVAGAIRTLSGYARSTSRHAGLDVIVVVRGGGARTDLAAFDAEAVVRAIAEAPVPVFTGLGHEIDRSVADEVAHRSLKTPTACAGALIDQVLAFRDRTEMAWSTITRIAGSRLDRHDQRLTDVTNRVAGRTQAAVLLAVERLDRYATRLPTLSHQRLTVELGHLDRAAARVAGEARRHLAVCGLRLDGAEGRARALDPAATLARGWTITRRTDGRLVRSPDDVAPGDELVTATVGGSIRSRVDDRGGPPPSLR